LTVRLADSDPALVQRRAAAVCILTGSTIAACIAIGPLLSSTQQASVVVSPQIVPFGNVEINTTSGIQTITIVPASGSATTVDNITAITMVCSDFTVTGPIPAQVILDCGPGTIDG